MLIKSKKNLSAFGWFIKKNNWQTHRLQMLFEGFNQNENFTQCIFTIWQNDQTRFENDYKLISFKTNKSKINYSINNRNLNFTDGSLDSNCQFWKCKITHASLCTLRRSINTMDLIGSVSKWLKSNSLEPFQKAVIF